MYLPFYLHSLPTLGERKTKVANELLEYLRRDSTQVEDVVTVCLEADICLSVTKSDTLRDYQFWYFETFQNEVGLFTRVSCKKMDNLSVGEVLTLSHP